MTATTRVLRVRTGKAMERKQVPLRRSSFSERLSHILYKIAYLGNNAAVGERGVVAAHDILRRAADQALTEKRSLPDVLKQVPEVKAHLSDAEIK
jgi:hypothetical protein